MSPKEWTKEENLLKGTLWNGTLAVLSKETLQASMSGLAFVKENHSGFRRSRPSQHDNLSNGAEQARARASAAERTLAGEHRSAIKHIFDGRRSGNFPLVSSELCLRLPYAVFVDRFQDRCKRGSGWKAGAAICPTGFELTSALPDGARSRQNTRGSPVAIGQAAIIAGNA